MNRLISNKIFILVLVGITFFGFQQMGYSQESSEGFLVTGKVNNPQGEKAVGAVILIKGTTTGTVTDTTGFFSIKVPSDQAVLVISHFSTPKSIEVPLNGGKKIVIRLGEGDESIPQLPLEGFKVYDQVDEVPQPTSGEEPWNQYLAKNTRYPLEARRSGVEGTVIVGFEIEKDGSIQNVEVIRGIGAECDQEAVRIVSGGPKWEPGKLGGEAVKTRMSLPIRFVLSGKSHPETPMRQTEKAIAQAYGKHLVVIGYDPVSK